MNNERKICTFYVDSFFFGIDVSKIQEVIRYQEMTHVPLTNRTISGLINMRGQIVTAIDMRERLHFESLAKDQKPVNIIVNLDDGPVSMLVDSIGDVIDIPLDMFEIPPESVRGNFKKVLKEVCQLEDQLLLILDIETLLCVENAA